MQELDAVGVKVRPATDHDWLGMTSCFKLFTEGFNIHVAHHWPDIKEDIIVVIKS